MAYVWYSLLLLCAIICATAGYPDTSSTLKISTIGQKNGSPADLRRGRLAILAACKLTLYPSLCFHSFMSPFPHQALLAPPPSLTLLSLQISSNAARNGSDILKALLQGNQISRPAVKKALKDCVELMASSNDQLTQSISRIANLDTRIIGQADPITGKPILMLHDQIQDALVWTSAALTFETTCSDGLSKKDISKVGDDGFFSQLQLASQYATNSLALLNHLESHLCTWNDPDSSTYPKCNIS